MPHEPGDPETPETLRQGQQVYMEMAAAWNTSTAHALAVQPTMQEVKNAIVSLAAGQSRVLKAMAEMLEAEQSMKWRLVLSDELPVAGIEISDEHGDFEVGR